MYKEKFNTIYFNGCSYTEGGGLNNSTIMNYIRKNIKSVPYKKALDNINIGNVVLANDNKLFIPEKEYAYPNIFKQLINNNDVNVINDAKCGGSLERVIRKVYSIIRENNIEFLRKKLFILELPPPGPNRLDLYSNRFNDYLVCNVTLGVDTNPKAYLTQSYSIPKFKIDDESQNKMAETILDYFSEFIDIQKSIQKNANELLGLISFFELHKIEYFLIGDTGFIYTALDNYFPKIDDRFIKVNYNGKIYRDIFQFASDEKLRICDEVNGTSDGHPGLSAHYIWAEKMYEFLENKLK